MVKKTKMKKRSSSMALAKRVKTLEIKQKADDKATERKRQYQEGIVSMNNVWQVATNFLINTQHGTAGQGTNTPGRIRIGDSVNLRSSSINFHCYLPRQSDGVPTFLDSSTRCRVLLVDNLDNIRGLGAGDILQNTAYPLVSPYKSQVDSGKRYRILGDYKFNLNAQVKADHQFKFKMPLPKSGRVVHYEGDAANPSDLNVSLIWFCKNISPLSAGQPTMEYYVNTAFEDK